MIKFRAWDKRKSTYTKVHSIDLFSNSVVIDSTSGFKYAEQVSMNEVILEQYTGLKDVNGVEIYEGDIVKVIEDSILGGTYAGAITYFDNWATFGFNMLDARVYETRDFNRNSRGFLSKMFGNCFTLAEATQFAHTDDGSNRFKLEVIGNIHENPDLLEQE